VTEDRKVYRKDGKEIEEKRIRIEETKERIKKLKKQWRDE
jgi:hypothetical protein